MMQSKDVEDMTNRLYGMMILDEVHASVAKEFSLVYSSIKSRCRIGLTATLVREDSKIGELDYLTGPLLYQQSWIKLMKDQYISTIKCFDIKCNMTPLFFNEYISTDNYRHKVILSSVNPTKLSVVQFLVDYHTKRKQQMIIFCDSIVVLKELSTLLNCPLYCGEIQNNLREIVLKQFKNGELMCVLMSSIGDTSLDIPDCTVIIQMSTHHGSRRQQLQRLGRITRITDTKKCGYFYTLTSSDTHEEYFVQKRQNYMQNMGFGFTIVNDMKTNPMPEDEQERLMKRCLGDADKRYFVHRRNSENKRRKKEENESGNVENENKMIEENNDDYEDIFND